MIVIGLTGGIASGKSTVSKMLAQFGACIIDADRIAREVVEPGQKAWKQIVAHFGHAVLLPDGTLDRKKLGSSIFSDKNKRRKLEEITHPEIRRQIRKLLTAARKAELRVAVLDIPLLIEVKWTDMVDCVWLIYTDNDTQMQRLMERDKLTTEQARQRLAAQMPLGEKRQYADVIIDNSGPPEETAVQIKKAWEGLLSCEQSH